MRSFYYYNVLQMLARSCAQLSNTPPPTVSSFKFNSVFLSQQINK
jgi:hypothetical protein